VIFTSIFSLNLLGTLAGILATTLSSWSSGFNQDEPLSAPWGLSLLYLVNSDLYLVRARFARLYLPNIPLQWWVIVVVRRLQWLVDG